MSQLTDEQIQTLAHRMATKYAHNGEFPYSFSKFHIADFARAIYKMGQEYDREECAKVCDKIEEKYYSEWKGKYDPTDQGAHVAADECAEAIRARKE